MKKDRILTLVARLKEKSVLFSQCLNEQVDRCSAIAEENMRIVQSKCQVLESEVDVQVQEMENVKKSVATLNALLVEMTGYLEDL